MPGEFESILTKLQGKLGKQTIRRASTNKQSDVQARSTDRDPSST